MGQFLLLVIAALVVGAIVFGVAVLITGDDPGIEEPEPDSRAVPLPASRPLREGDVGQIRFDTALRGYRMAQVDSALRRAAYDIGYKDELVGVLEAEITALREGRTEDADTLHRARVAAMGGAVTVDPAEPVAPESVAPESVAPESAAVELAEPGPAVAESAEPVDDPAGAESAGMIQSAVVRR